MREKKRGGETGLNSQIRRYEKYRMTKNSKWGERAIEVYDTSIKFKWNKIKLKRRKGITRGWDGDRVAWKGETEE